MFDGIQSGLGPCESNIVGILPGSRDEVVGNIQQVLCVIEQLELLKERRFIMALSPNVTYEKLHQAVQSCAWTIDRQGRGMCFNTHVVVLLRCRIRLWMCCISQVW